MTFSVSIAKNKDIQSIMEMLYPDYFEETIFGKAMTYDEDNTYEMVRNYVHNKICVLCKDGENIAGIAVILAGNTFYKEIEADIDFFMVRKRYRKTVVARMLAEEAQKQAEKIGAKVIYAACASGIDDKNDNMFSNLWKKYGFEKLGTAMIKKVA